MEAMIQNQNRTSPSVSDTAHPGSVSSQSTLVTQTLGPQLGSVRNDVDATTSTWNEAQHLRSMGIETLLLENPALMSFVPQKAAPSYQNPSNSTNPNLAETVQQSAETFPDRHVGSKEDSDATNVDKEATILAPQVVNWEHHGPGSWLSVCSRPGLDWVAQRTGVPDFENSARELVSTWTRRLTLDRNKITCTQHREPDPETAWKYSYFEDSFDSTLGIVYRPEFESALRAHFRGDLVSGDDAAWFALRKTVYASGCRIYLSKNTSMSFTEIQTEAWSYFQSAMSVLIELLFTPTGLLAVRALVAMAFFAEGLGNPALEYMFCASAARVAQAKGLHRRPAKAWNVAAHDELHYSWLFWAIYCCEKHIAHRSGRPSAIDDDEISCQIPSEACPGSTLDVEAFTYLIRHAQISSQISKRLMSVKAFQQPPSTLLETVAELDHQLHEWRDSLPPGLRPDDRLRSFQASRDARYLPTILMHCAYYGSLMAIHTIFAYPWVYSTIFGNGRGVVTQDQVIFSSNTVAEAARNIIIIARSLEINGASIQWPTFYYPMIGLINLFIHILKFPSLPSARSDVALLDVAAGYFGHMEFITSSELNFPFARDVATVARQTVNKASKTDAPAITSADDGFSLANDVDIPFGDIFCASQDFNLDDWSVFSSVFSDEALMNREIGF
ncbi:Fungal specific transcription factor domain-containing protein [Cladophialophora immunda]|nr:Fungal specific transcription factor domain-containing protein [Cladophialophora immunda]